MECPFRGTADADYAGTYKPGGASCRSPAHLASALNRHEKSEMTEKDERKRTIFWHDAAFIA